MRCVTTTGWFGIIAQKMHKQKYPAQNSSPVFQVDSDATPHLADLM